MSISDQLIESATSNGWLWGEEGVLIHPSDDELTIRKDLYSGHAILSPKLVRLFEIENGLESDI